MSQAEALLASMSDEIPVHTHPVPDTDTYFIIDPITRKIENTNPKKSVIMQYDHNSERFTFELPRYIDGHDMLECTSVTVNVDNIEVIESDGVEEVEPRVNPDAPDMTDLRVHPSDPEKVISSWLISRNSTQLAGILSFHIEYKCVDSNGNVVYEWSTDNYDEIKVRPRKKNGEAAVIEHSDLLEQWRTRIFRGGDSVMASIAAVGEAQIAAVKAESETQQEAVELKGAQTLDTIPEDYTQVDAMADEAVRSKGDAIVCEATSESIVIKDSSNDHIRRLKLFGKSKQVTTTGKNLFDVMRIESTDAIVNNNGVITVNIPAGSSAVTTRKTLTELAPLLQVGETYIITFDTTGSDKFIYLDVANRAWTSGLAHTITQEMLDSTVYLYGSGVSTSAVISNIMLRSTSANDETYEPYTGGKPSPNPEYPQDIVSVENPTVSSYGKNLLNCSDISLTDFTNHYYTIYTDFQPIIGETYALSMNVNTDVLPFAINIGCGSTKYDADMSPKISASYTENGRIVISFKWAPTQEQVESGYTKLFIRVPRYASKTTFNATVTNIQLELGSEVTEYEPYKPVQSVAIPHTLPGIPVTSGGTYTDENGQQWISDEVDLERGVYVQNTAIVNLYDFVDKFCVFSDNSKYSDTILRFDFGYAFGCRVVTPVLCNRFVYDYAHGDLGSLARVKEGISSHSASDIITVFIDKSRLDTPDKDGFKAYLQNNDTIVCYALVTPIETPLTAEEITAFKALRTNYPNTTILNDAGAWMSVKYNADTKSYVDKPKALRLTDTSTGVVYELKIVDGSLTVVPV